MLIRFAGPRLAERSDDLVPVPLRSGGRALGGALSWSEPQRLAPFEPGSPFHGIDLPEETAKELEGLVTTMVQLEYIDMDEVAEIPQLEEAFGVALYAPLADAEFEPDAVSESVV